MNRKDLRVIGFFVGTGILNLLVGYAIAVLVSDYAPTFAWKVPKLKLACPHWLTLGCLLSRLTAVRTKLAAVVTRMLGLLRRTKSPLPEMTTELSATTDIHPAETETSGEPPVPEPLSPLQDVPKAWLNTLLAEGLEPQSFVEATAQVLRLEVGKYREQLLVADGRARQCQATGNAEALELLRCDLARINQTWLVTQQHAAQQLAGQNGKMDGYEATGKALEDTLLDQAAQIETTDSNLAALDFKHDPATAAKRVSLELGRLIDLAHTLRDRMFDALALIMRSERRLTTLPDSLLRDALTGLLNRVGFEQLVHEWGTADMARLRMVSLCLVDIDRVGRLNERLGPRAGDRILAVISSQLAGFLRKDRGCDRVVRVAGQRFLLFLGDTGPRQALAAVERIRQSVEALTLNCDGTEIEFTVSFGVCELDCNELTSESLHRAQLALKEAQQAGRNRCAIDEGNGPEVIIDPPRYTVKSRVVDVPVLG